MKTIFQVSAAFLCLVLLEACSELPYANNSEEEAARQGERERLANRIVADPASNLSEDFLSAFQITTATFQNGTLRFESTRPGYSLGHLDDYGPISRFRRRFERDVCEEALLRGFLDADGRILLALRDMGDRSGRFLERDRSC